MQDHRPTENNVVPNNPQAEEFRKSHWTVDKFVDQAREAQEQGRSLDGIIKPGEVDEAHVRFLETTTFAKEEVKKNE